MIISLIFRRAITSATALLCVVGLAAAQSARVDRLEILNAGFYTSHVTGQVKNSGSPTGTEITEEKVTFLKGAPANAASVGTIFGVQARLFGQPENANVVLREVWNLPAPGTTDPKTGNNYRQVTFNFTARIGSVQTRGYGFDNSWEVLRGVWTQEIWQGDRKLLERSYTIP